eukprot:2362145-Ditylum_brightwellii.AAC.1
MNLSNAYKKHFASLASNDNGNSNMSAFSLTLDPSLNEEERVRAIGEDVDTVVPTANMESNIHLLHSPMLFGGIRTRPNKKLICLLGMEPVTVGIEINIKSVVAK